MDNINPSQNPTIPDEMRTYIIGLLNDASMGDMDPDLREEMIKEIFERLDKYITSVIIENLSAESVETFIKMNEEKRSQAEIQKFMMENIPNATEVMTKAFVDFRELYLGKVTVASTVPTPQVND